MIVPGFGGFVCNREPARIDQVSHVITPPSRKVVFNQNLKTNDGLLAGYMVQHHSMGYSQAIQLIEESVQQTLTMLQEKKQLAIDLFGNFRLNADANYVFLPDKRNNYLISSFGLGLIQAEPVASRSVRVIKSRTFKDRKDAKTMKPERNLWPAVLTGVLALLLTVNGYIFLSDHSIRDLHIGQNSTMSISSWFDSLFQSKKTETPELLPVGEPAAAIARDSAIISPAPAVTAEISAPVINPSPEPAHTQTAVTEPAVDLYASLHVFATHFETSRGNIRFPQPPADVEELTPVSKNETVVPAPAPVSAPSAAVLSTSGIAAGYYVIGGVFCKERNAKKYLAQLNESGYAKAELLLNENIHCKRVSYQKFASRREAEQFCIEIKSSTNPGAWVLAAE